MEEMNEELFDTEHVNARLWRRILALLAHEKRTLFFATGLMFMEAGITTVLPILNSYAIDHFFAGKGSNQDIMVFALAYAALIIFQAFIIYQFIYQCGVIEMSVSYNTRQKVMEKLQNLSFSYFDKTPTGWIMARVTSDIARLSEILSWSLIDLLWGLFFMAIMMIVMLSINWQLALIVLSVMPFVYLISAFVQKRILRHYRKVRAVNSKITGFFSEGIAGAKTTKTMALEARHYSEFAELTAEMKAKSMRSVILSAVYIPVVNILSSMGSAGVLWLGGSMVINQVIMLGTLVMFTQFANQFFEPLRNIAGILAQMQMAQASAERVISLLDKEVDLIDKEAVIERYGTVLDPKVENYDPMLGKVEFRNVSFHYIPEEPILENFNLTVQARQRIALVGETGSGKSTIVNLICRFYEPTSGELLIDDLDYREHSLGWLHSNLGYVLQAPHLFSGTILENIRYGRLNATDEEIMEVCKLINAHSFILDLEEGYQTDVGEGGNRLSTGQKQLISLARALIADPAIFVLDEATSSIDTETEAIIQYAVDTVLREKTSFIIAHRLSTIVSADRILVIRDGKIIEDGNHETLLEQKGYYHDLYTQQFKEDEEVRLREYL